MTTYSPSSSLGWLDLDAAASERVAALLRSLEEPGSLDALGLGSIRDAFSTMLSPGTSTTQTRIRYFIFLPWILSRLEAERVRPADFAQRLRDDEVRLIGRLHHLGPKQGVIGYKSGRNLKRMPSAAYWSGLGKWRLRRLNLSLAQYGQRAAALGQRQPDRDDEGHATVSQVSMWAALPSPPDDFLQADINFDLRREEAVVLIDHIRRTHSGTLLAYLCGNPKISSDLANPWDLPERGLPKHLVEALRHARWFSELTIGTQHVYNVLLARKARDELEWDTADLEESELDHLKTWVKSIGARRDDPHDWVKDLDGFWNFLSRYGISASTKAFVTEIATQATRKPDGFAENRTVHELICQRESLLKSKRARLSERSALENWKQVPLGGSVNYRWSITQSFLSDLAEGLEVGE